MSELNRKMHYNLKKLSLKKKISPCGDQPGEIPKVIQARAHHSLILLALLHFSISQDVFELSDSQESFRTSTEVISMHM